MPFLKKDFGKKDFTKPISTAVISLVRNRITTYKANNNIYSNNITWIDV
jgi:hypothetical protein